MSRRKIIPGKKYTREQLRSLIETEEDSRKLQFKGYVLRHDLLDDTYMLVHWTKAATPGRTQFDQDGQLRQVGREGNNPFSVPRMAYDPYAFTPPPPLVRRTPQQRKESLIKRWWEGCQKAGTVPGMTDEEVSSIVGVDWKTGQTEMTGEIIDRLASAMLMRAERKREADDFSRTVRQGPND